MTILATPSSHLFLGLVSWYGLLIVAGALLAVYLADRESKVQGLPPDTILDLALIALPVGILGARLYYVVFSWPMFASDPLSVLYIWEGGLAIYGGLIAGFAVVALFCRRRGISLPLMLDILIPGVALAQAVGRWGNYFNQEAYGTAISAESSFAFFPIAVLIQQGADPSWHLATFFYESVLDFAIFLFLTACRRKLFRKHGDMFLFYVIFYASGRMVIENLRMDSLYLGSSIRISQLLSAVLCLGLIALFAYRDVHRREMSVLRWILLGLLAVSGLLILMICLNISFPARLSGRSETYALLIFALLSITTSLALYGRSSPSEVCYADHKV